LFDTARPEEQEDFDSVRIDVRDTAAERDGAADPYSTSFYGVITGVGNASGGPERMFKARAQGPGHFLNNFEASYVTDGLDIADVFEYLIEQIEGAFPFDVTYQWNETEEVPQTYGEVLEKNVRSRKTFQSNKHTLADVTDWLKDKTGTRVWLEPTTDGVVFVATDTPTQRNHTAHYLSRDGEPADSTLPSGGVDTADDSTTYIIDNNALSELLPVNSITVNGQAKGSLGSVGDFEITVPSATYFTAKARHEGLYQRSGQTELRADTVKKTDAITKEEVMNEAVSRLKEYVDESTAGGMEVLLRAPITPFDTIEAQPTCDGDAVGSTEPLTYECQRVHHKIHPNGDRMPHTVLTVGLHTDMQEDIVIKDSWVSEEST
jgi:hypothetical protein